MKHRHTPLDGPAPRDETGARILEWRPAGSDGEESRYARAFARAREWALERHREIQRARNEARGAARRLLGESRGRRELLVRNHPGYSGWRLAAILVDEVEGGARGRAVARGERMGLAALAASLVLGVEKEDGPWAADVASRALRVLADLQIEAGELDAARRSVAAARRHLRRGTRDPLERADLMLTTGVLLAARGRRTARRALLGAAGLYGRLSETVGEGRARVYLALHVLGDGGTDGDVGAPDVDHDPQDVVDEMASAAARVALGAPGGETPAAVLQALDELRFGLDLLGPVEDPVLHRLGLRRLRQLAGVAPVELETSLADLFGGLPAMPEATPDGWNEPA